MVNDGGGPADQRLSVRLSVRAPDGALTDVAVSADPRVTVGQLSDALARYLRIQRTGMLRSDRAGTLDPDMALRTARLRDGDLVALTFTRSHDSRPGASNPAAELVLVGGPQSGVRIPLGAGTSSVGRDSGCDVVIEDPSLSRRHLAIHVERGGGTSVSDEGSSNGTAIDGVRLDAGERHTLASGDQVEAGRSMLVVQPWRAADQTRVVPAGSRISFNRPPRVSRVFEAATLRVSAPPAKQRTQRIPLVAALIPVVMGAALFAYTSNPMMLMMAAFTPVMMIGTVVTDRRSGRKDYETAVGDFTSTSAKLADDLTEAQRNEIAERRAASPDAGELAALAARHLPELWERRPADADFLDVRVGVADQPTTTQVAFPDGGDPELRVRIDELVAARRTTPAVPVRIRLTEAGAIGLSGPAELTDAAARWLIAQMAVLQSPRDVVIAAALSDARAPGWQWLNWLPHVTNAASLLDAPGLAVGTTAATELLRQAARLAAERREESAGRARGRRRTTLVLLVDDEVAPQRAVVDELLADCAEVDIVAIWLARERRELPGGCGALVEMQTGRAVCSVTWTESGRTINDASADGLPADVADGIARGLAPVIDVTAGGASDVPRFVSLTRLLDLVEPDADAIVRRWEHRASDLRAVIGAAAGEPFSVDLRSDGPHALIAGTTGAGKSELLQTLVTSLAASHPPDRLAFLLVDYKGGAAFKDCVKLPHTAGMVTDLDEHEVHRALLSLNAELKRREHLLGDAGAKDLLELERRDPATAPPSLVIVIDEFATLAKEVPSFVDGVVDVAQRGRSLGVHLILATQRPGNVVTENIRANTNLRIALRVAATAESDDVINAPDAGRLPRSISGRALARTGPSELTTFQTAYVGGITRPDRALEAIEVRPLWDGTAHPAGSSRAGEDDEATDLDALVGAIDAAADQAGLQRPAAPWLPSLPDAIEPDAAARAAGTQPLIGDARAIIGLVDEPRRQRRAPYTVDLAADGSLLVYGGTAAGKTTLLRTLAATLASQCSPDDLHIYALDFAGRGLAGLEALPHCGSVIPGEDEQRVARMLSKLRRTIDERARLLSAAGALDIAEYRRGHPATPMPRLLVLLDSYAGFTDIYEKIDLGAMVEAIPRLVADGRTAGVHFVITADRRTAVPSSITSLISRRLVLRMANEDEYAMLGVDAREVRGAHLPPGRGFLDDGREVQVAVVGGSAEGADQTAALAALADQLTATHTGSGAPAITAMPLEVPRAELPPASAPLHAVLGIDELELAPVEISLRDMHFVVIGPYRSGRSTALAAITRSVTEATPEARVHLLAARRSPLEQMGGWATAAHGTDECDEHITQLLDEVMGGQVAGPTVVVIDDAGELAESPSQGALEQLIKRGRDRDVRVIASLETGQARHYAAWIRELRKDSHGLLLDPNMDIDGDLLSVRLPRKSNPLYPPGRGYLVAGGATMLVQVAREV